MKTKFENITDEQLAAFIDGNASEKETNEILDAVQSKNDLETIALAFSIQARKDGEEDVDDMPDVTSLGKIVEIRPFERLPMAGFLGNKPQSHTANSDNETKE